MYATKDELWEAVQLEMKVANKEVCQNLITSMGSGVEAVIKGSYTKY